jgi:uncharacterized UPF0160 family protein
LQKLNCLTHSGPFHSDDVLAGVLLKCAGVIDNFEEIKRSRDPKEFEKADLVFDVGGDYDAATHRYDHHQRGRSGMEWDDGTPYSSAGLIWHHFKEQITEDEDVQKSLVGSYVRPIDADDNGWIGELPPNARHISAIVSDMNPRWDDKDADVDQCYVQACLIMEQLFLGAKNKAEGKKAAKTHVLNAVEKHLDQELLILEHYCPWKSHLHKIEEELCPESPFQFVLFPQGDSWKIFQVPADKGSKEGRAYFPEPWGGLREEELKTASGIAGAQFVHPGLFCAGAASLEDAKAMAKQAIQSSNEPKS